jgi:FMN-dependent NADH-azoreductase
MPNLLVIESSPRGDYSVSRALTATFVEAWQKSHAGGQVVVRDLAKTTLPFVDLPWIAGAYTPAEQHSPEMQQALQVSNQLIAELQAADHIVLGTSMYNFSTPAILKAYIDQIVRVGVTFSSSYEGLLKNKKAVVIVASAGEYAPGSYMESYNADTGYIKQIFGFIGITDLTFVLAGGTADIDQGKVKREDLLAKYVPEVQAAAQ